MLRGLTELNLPELEERVLRLWKERRVFEESLAGRQAADRDGKKRGPTRRKRFVFYEGPPTANGKPGIHHVLTRSFKDIVLRYKTMRGFHVPRRAGWDTHGLPVEIAVEKELGLKSKREIEAYGIAAFNTKCKESVWRYKDEWERLTERIGFWLDMSDPYVTYDNAYIEALWGILREARKQKLLYKGHRVVPWCSRCGTSLSSHELAQGYKTVTDTSVYVKFKVKSGQKIGQGFVADDQTYVLSWTTTPWTLPGNVALAVGSGIKYLICSAEGPVTSRGTLIFAQDVPGIGLVVNEALDSPGQYADCLSGIRKISDVEGLRVVEGRDLVGLRYEPLFDVKALRNKQSHQVYAADFVTTTDGTGVVHTAVMYGEDDYRLGAKVGLPQRHTVDEQGRFTDDVRGFAGMAVKAQETEAALIDSLRTRGLLLKTEPYEHEYPHCWRCSTPLLYYARDSWFIAMQKLRDTLVRENKKIHWIPDNVRDGRMGEWLKEVKDWAISRNRYWGTPLPIWECGGCGAARVIGGRAELARACGVARNEYVTMRHGLAENNVRSVVSTDAERSEAYPLTLEGRVAAEAAALELKKRRKKPDMIFASDLRRTRETAEIVGKAFGVPVRLDARLREIQLGPLEGRPIAEYHAQFSSTTEKFSKAVPGGETLRQIAARMFSFIADAERQHKGKTILIVSHEYPLWMLEAVLRGWGEEEAVREKRVRGADFIAPGKTRSVPYAVLPRNEHGFADLHRPFVDGVTVPCAKCGKTMRRVPEVADVWFDSGAMPWASQTVQFLVSKSESLNRSKGQNLKINYPADYICEAVDQTRGWFYTLLAVGTVLGRGRAYKRALSLGHVLDRQGQKMSKSKGNIVDPWEMIGRYGADAVRWYFYTVNAPGEPKRFDERDLAKVSRQFFNLAYNSYVFWETYADKGAGFGAKGTDEKSVLDRWVMALLRKTTEEATKYLEAYEIGRAARTLEEFLGDLSRWYIRRSRRRFQRPEDEADYRAASSTLRHVLEEFGRLLAPFTPFFAEALYQSVRVNADSGADSRGSVHLEAWFSREAAKDDAELLKQMALVRELAALGLAKRSELGIKVRQPLSKMWIKNLRLQANSDLSDILKDEVNVKEVVFDPSLESEVELDTTVTPALKEEGTLREVVRSVQGLRQDAGLRPKDEVVLMIASERGEAEGVFRKNEALVRREVGARSIVYGKQDKFDAELEMELDAERVWVGLRKM